MVPVRHAFTAARAITGKNMRARAAYMRPYGGISVKPHIISAIAEKSFDQNCRHIIKYSNIENIYLGLIIP